jgi:hypothetical protein
MLLTLIAIGNAALWIVARPADQPTSRYAGEMCGAEAALFSSIALVLATLLPARLACGLHGCEQHSVIPTVNSSR